MKKNLYCIVIFLAIIFIAFFSYLFRYDYSLDKKSRVDRFTQKYEVNCIRKNAFMSVDECNEATPYENFLNNQNQNKLNETLNRHSKNNNPLFEGVDLTKCDELLEKAKLRYEDEEKKKEDKNEYVSLIYEELKKECSGK